VEYLADVNKLGQKTVIVEATSEDEALEILIEEWGEDNIIIPPHKSDCQERIEAVRSEY
jgi:hypothetical protein